jgi:AcrR family transcriptional regulator
MTYARGVPSPGTKKTKPRRVRLDVDERRAQLIALGLQFFSGRAYDEVPIEDLAREAGISKGLLYHYFPTKRDFYVATVREAARQLLDRTRPDEHLPPLERLRAGVDAYLAYVEQHGPAYTALLRGGIGSDAEVAAVIEGTRTEFLARLLEGLDRGAQIEPRLRLLLRGYIGFIEAASLEWVERRDLDRAELRDLLADLFPTTLDMAFRPGAPPRAR